MATTKEETALNFLHKTYTEYHITFRENSITQSYDFIIDTETAKVLIKIEQKRWDNLDSSSIVSYLQSKEQKIHKALLTNESEILSMK